ncbi:TPA: hypothetical protein ACIBFG_004490 [Salmonella enterica subsp. enterica serovar Bahrenfeld]|nr:hypothetical protein [Salmonella enterica]HAR9009713.1 hypothetical protein [Salmonella enterica]HAR9317394.1 hypothetical protein [Salmonella enterica]
MRMQSNMITLLICCVCIGTGCQAAEENGISQGKLVSAQNPTPFKVDLPVKTDDMDNKKSVAEKLAEIKSEVILLNAEAQRAEALKKLEKVDGEKKNVLGDGIDLPTLKSVFGHDDSQLKAELMFDSGDVVEASTDNVLPNGMKVISITPTSVYLQDSNGNKHIVTVKHIEPKKEYNKQMSFSDFNSDIPTPRLR